MSGRYETGGSGRSDSRGGGYGGNRDRVDSGGSGGGRDRFDGGSGGRDRFDGGRSGGGAYGGRDRAPGGNRDRASSGSLRESLAAQEKRAAPRETGVIKTLRESFGFVRCCDQDAELFFHYSEVTNRAEADLKEGDEVEFGLYLDKKNDKMNAVLVTVLPPGTVSFQTPVAEGLSGVIDRELRTAGRQASRADSYGGRITFEREEGNKESALFGGGDVDFSYRPQLDDKVSFNLVLDKPTKRLCATKIKLVERVDSLTKGIPEGTPREQGVIDAVKENFGFIQCADRDERLFFHFTEVYGEKQVRSGDEVEFFVLPDKRSAKNNAVRITLLPKGTVKFDTEMEGRLTGRIERELRNTSGSGSSFRDRSRPPRDKDLAGGIISVTIEGVQIRLPFGGLEVSEPRVQLKIGDEVEFTCVLNRPTKSKKATKVKLVRLNPEGRETGIVKSLKDSFGFIRCCDREEELFFHFSELVDPEARAAVGTEVEFFFSAKDERGDKACATRIVILPPGSVSFETRLSDTFTATVSQPISGGSSALMKRSEQTHGVLSVTRGETVVEMQFSHGDLSDPAVVLRPGDQVELAILVEKRSGKERVADVSLIAPGPFPLYKAEGRRGTGTILFAKGAYGYIRCCEEDLRLYFDLPKSEVVADDGAQVGDAQDGESAAVDAPESGVEEPNGKKGGRAAQRPAGSKKYKVGAEVEYTVVEEPCTRRLTAVDLNFLPKNSVVFEVPLIAEVLAGVAGDFGGKKKGSEIGSVSITIGDAVFKVPVAVSDFEDPKLSLRKGDPIECLLWVEVSTGLYRASNLMRAAESGLVESVREQGGSLVPFERNSRNLRDKAIPFNFADVVAGAALAVGDEVSFYETFSSARREVQATRIKWVKPATSTLELMHWRSVNGIQSTPRERPEIVSESLPADRRREVEKQVYRQSKGPDGTRGFAAGRGRTPAEFSFPVAGGISVVVDAPEFIPSYQFQDASH